MKTSTEINEQIEALQTRMNEAVEKLEKGDSTTEEVASVKAMLDDDIKPKLETLTAAHDQAILREDVSGLVTSVKSLGEAVTNELRKPADGFSIMSTPEGKAVSDSDSPYADESYSIFTDITLANKGDVDAKERLKYGVDRFSRDSDYKIKPEGKAMTEGVEAQGGYLVQPELERQLVLAREADNVLRPLCSSLQVNTNSIQLDQLGIKTGAAWVAELAAKFEETGMSILSVTANVYTAAGLATVSNQLLADSNPAVDGLLTADLAKRIVALEETAFLNGSGTGQPRGILNTSGVSTKTITSTGDPATEGGLLDVILDSIAQVQLDWGQPSAILMHPRTWTAIVKSRDAAGHYTIAPRNNFGAGYDPATPRTFITGPEQTLFGAPVVLSNRMPTTLGGGEESRIIVGDFSEALILDRQGLTVDESAHVYFTTNQTVFRAESRVGFTAARQPKAFCVIGGEGLAKR